MTKLCYQSITLLSLFVSSLKGGCHEIFDLHFFHDSDPSRLLLNRLKYSIFEFFFDFTEIFDYKVRKIRLRGVHDTAELKF